MPENSSLIKISELRRSAFILGAVLLFVAWRQISKGAKTPAAVIGTCALCIILLGIFKPEGTRILFFVLRKILEAILGFTTLILLTLVYAFIITPIGLALRLGGSRNLMDRKHDAGRHSYWVPVQSAAAKRQDYEKQF